MNTNKPQINSPEIVDKVESFEGYLENCLVNTDTFVNKFFFPAIFQKYNKEDVKKLFKRYGIDENLLQVEGKMPENTSELALCYHTMNKQSNPLTENLTSFYIAAITMVREDKYSGEKLSKLREEMKIPSYILIPKSVNTKELLLKCLNEWASKYSKDMSEKYDNFLKEFKQHFALTPEDIDKMNEMLEDYQRKNPTLFVQNRLDEILAKGFDADILYYLEGWTRDFELNLENFKDPEITDLLKRFNEEKLMSPLKLEQVEDVLLSRQKNLDIKNLQLNEDEKLNDNTEANVSQTNLLKSQNTSLLTSFQNSI